jgi:CheY-like chemotaxis protein/HPt (histidine-containing phosphotransfer) domain-containing protein
MREGTLEGVRILAIGGDEDLPSEVRGAPRMLALGRQVGDVELRSALQRLLDRDGSAGEAAPAAVDSLLPPPLPTEHRHATAGAMPAAIVPPAAAGVPVVAGAVGGHVLLVEDNPVNRQVAQRLLALVGVSHDVAENGKQALDCLAQSRYDAVLMDCQMPIMDGYTATRTMRRLEADGQRKGHLPIIAMTANAMAGDREKCLGAGMDDYMSKPLNRALLEQTLRKWIAPGTPTRAGATTIATPSAAPASRPVPAPAGAATAVPGTRTPASTPPIPTSLAPTPIAMPRIGAAVVEPDPATLDQRAPAAFGLSGNLGSPIDAGVIQDLLEVMGDEFTDLVRVYLEDAPKSVSQLERAAMTGSVDGLVAPAHSLKSTSANLGALSLSDMAKRIEHGARSGGLPGEAVLLVAELGNEYQRVAAEFRRLLGGGA